MSEAKSKWYRLEHILCERRTIYPERNKGNTQYLVKYFNYDFHYCYWVHASSIYPHTFQSIFWNWNQLTKKEKQERYIFLNKPKDFMCLSDLQKNKLGWKYVGVFSLDVFCQTPNFDDDTD